MIQRHDPVWARDPMDGEVSSGPVDVRFRLVQQRGSELDATVTYRLGGRSWIQPFTARIVDDEDLRVEAAAHGLHLERWLDTDRTWALLRATES